jgi:hypothetical protein
MSWSTDRPFSLVCSTGQKIKGIKLQKKPGEYMEDRRTKQGSSPAAPSSLSAFFPPGLDQSSIPAVPLCDSGKIKGVHGWEGTDVYYQLQTSHLLFDQQLRDI